MFHSDSLIRWLTDAYTDGGRLASVAEVCKPMLTYGYDDAGQITLAGGAQLAHEGGHIATMTAGSVTATYTHDPRGRRDYTHSAAASSTLWNWDYPDSVDASE